jgi:hypothetical protein
MLAQAYAPLRPPPGAPMPAEQEFDDRAGLDQSLYDVLSRWAHDDISSQDPQRLERALVYLGRAERLAGISAAQREDLRSLRAESGFFEALSLVDRAAEQLRLAHEKLRLAADSQARHATEALVLLRRLEPLGEEVLRLSRAAGPDGGHSSPQQPAASSPPPPPSDGGAH